MTRRSATRIPQKNTTVDNGNRQTKNKQKLIKLSKKFARLDEHFFLTRNNIPRRVNGNKLGLRKRTALANETMMD